MNKKQAGIIVVLLALIVCAGVLATKASTSNPFYVSVNDGGKTAITSNTSDGKIATDTFAELRLSRDHSDANAIQGLKDVLDDKNTPSDGKNDASKKMSIVTTTTRLETRIEEQLKLAGFADAFCYIDDNKAKVTVNCKEKLNDKQMKQINGVVMDVAQIRNVTIEAKQ